MPFYSDFLAMEVDETVGQSQTNCFKYQSNEEFHEKFDFHVSESGWSSSNPSSPESPNLNRNFYKRKGQSHSRDIYRTNYAQKVPKNSGLYSPGSFTGSINSPNSSLEKSFIRTGQESTLCKENQFLIGLKPSERISYIREILPVQNQSGYTSRSKWELMAPPKAPLRRPHSPSSHLI
ncbi:GSCOCG00008110001-RA-CDS [Cotesia congregata]|uniref:Uncharacterized protein n=1 Tax=Cotesia congregata TaxID=51543 RepID=A0A8J2HPB5_COTCN|nr:GSCOCG00008110001-RA-CDS [Cotesia congregata]CAG5107675.1 Protein of unknown function [Cotesia congregata]